MPFGQHFLHGSVDSAELCWRPIVYRTVAYVSASGNTGVNHSIETTPTGHFLFFCEEEFHLKQLHWCHPNQCPNKINHTGYRMQAFGAIEPLDLYLPGETGNSRPFSFTVLSDELAYTNELK